MQRSAAKLALAAGAVLVLALAIGLVRLMPGATEPTEPAAPTRSPPAPENVPAPVPVAARAPAPPLAARDLPSASATRHAAVAPRAQPPELPAPPISLTPTVISSRSSRSASCRRRAVAPTRR